MKDLYNFNTLKKEREEDTRRWKDLPWSWINTISTIKLKTNMYVILVILQY